MHVEDEDDSSLGISQWRLKSNYSRIDTKASSLLHLDHCLLYSEISNNTSNHLDLFDRSLYDISRSLLVLFLLEVFLVILCQYFPQVPVSFFTFVFNEGTSDIEKLFNFINFLHFPDVYSHSSQPLIHKDDVISISSKRCSTQKEVQSNIINLTGVNILKG